MPPSKPCPLLNTQDSCYSFQVTFHRLGFQFAFFHNSPDKRTIGELTWVIASVHIIALALMILSSLVKEWRFTVDSGDVELRAERREAFVCRTLIDSS